MLNPHSIDLDRIPPAIQQATDAEQALCGAVIMDVRQLDALGDVVTGRDFYDVELGRMFDAMVSLRQAGVPIQDPTTLVRHLEAMDILQHVLVGGIAGRPILAKLCAKGIASSNAPLYANSVRECASRRRISEAAMKAWVDSYEVGLTPKEIAERAVSQFEAVLASDIEETQDIQTVVDSEVDAIERFSAEGKPMALSSGFSDLDELTGGLHPNELIVLAARPSIGKTAFALDLCVNVALRGSPVLFVSLEMGAQQIAHRMIARETGIPARRIQKGELTTPELLKVRSARASLKELALPIKLFATGHASAARISARARIQAAQSGLKLLVIDYLGLMQSNERHKTTYERVTAISREVKLMAQALKVPVVLLAQLNREASKGTPTLEHLRDSGAIEQDADNVWFLHREDRTARETKLMIAKQRQGETGFIDFDFDGAHMMFTEAMGEPIGPVESKGQLWNSSR